MVRAAMIGGLWLVLAVGGGFPVAAATQESAADQPALSTVAWDVFTVAYPEGRWTATVEEHGDRASFRLASTVRPDVTLQINFTRGLPSEDDPKYDANPHMTSLAALLPLALELSQQDNSKVIVSEGLINLPEYWDTSARVAVLLDESRVLNMEAGHFLLKDAEQTRLAIAVLSSLSQRGQVDDSPEHSAVIGEAYGIVQGIGYPRGEE